MHALASKLSMLNEGQQQIIFQKMADLDGKTVKEVAAMFDGLADKEVKQSDLFSLPHEAVKRNQQEEPAEESKTPQTNSQLDPLNSVSKQASPSLNGANSMLRLWLS